MAASNTITSTTFVRSVTADEFVQWLRGFLAAAGDELDAKQVATLREQLEHVGPGFSFPITPAPSAPTAPACPTPWLPATPYYPWDQHIWCTANGSTQV